MFNLHPPEAAPGRIPQSATLRLQKGEAVLPHDRARGCGPLGDRDAGRVALRVRGECGARFRGRKQIHARLIRHAISPLAGHFAARVAGEHGIVARQCRSVTVGIGKERTLLFGACEQVGAAPVTCAPLRAALDPRSFVNEADRAEAFEPQWHGTVKVGAGRHRA